MNFFYFTSKKPDDPTRYSSKKSFIDAVRTLFRESPDRMFAVVCVDLIGFRLYNDKFGVESGDRFLVEMAKNIREYENPRKGVFASCYASSDKFFLCFDDSRFDPDKLLYDLKEMFQKLSAGYELNARLGIIRTNASLDAGQACDRAQLAVNSIKHLYDVRYVYFDEELLQRVARENELTKSMNSALIRGEFQPFFQPQFDVTTKKVIGAEMLVRWNSGKFGFLMPSDFVPLFEKNRCITEVDMYLWGMAGHYLRHWKEEGIDFPYISVNVSRTDFYRGNIAEYLKDIADKNKINPAQLHVEITESSYYENHGQFMDILNKLLKYGFIIEIDDFGIGYSSLSMLLNFPFSVVKLDKTFIDANQTERGKVILSSTIEMIKNLGMTVVTEGVETEEQYEFVKSVGADVIQGFFFEKPLDAGTFEKLLQTKKLD